MVQLPDGRRVSIRTGLTDRRADETVKLHLEHLLTAKVGGTPLPASTAAWLNTIPEVLRDRLERAGPLELRLRASLLSEFVRDYMSAVGAK